MYRQRLKSRKGCLRCKARHHKCDERRPQCSFCARHDVACIWSPVLQSRSSNNKESTATKIHTPSVVDRGPAGCESRPQLDPFHPLPVRGRNNVEAISDHLHTFFVNITQSTLPFDVGTQHQELTRGWLTPIYADEAVCSAFVTYIAWFYSERAAGESGLNDLRHKYEARSLALLRHRVEIGMAVTEGTLLTAVLHFLVATLNVQSVAQLSQMARGISALIMAMGGPSVTVSSVTPSTRQSLIFADIFNALLTAQIPFLPSPTVPIKPSSFASFPIDSAIDAEMATCLGRELVKVLQDMRFVLFFLSPSKQTRHLSPEEAQYLFMLLQKISYTLCNQQNRLTGTRSLAETAVYAMILVKEEVFLDVIQHPIMPTTILRRLHSVVAADTVALRKSNATIVLWASMIALTRIGSEEERTWALEHITGRLVEKYGLSWPRDWIAEIRQDLQRVLWHDRIEVAFTKVCTTIDKVRKQSNTTQA